jgi:hypothetical protein
MLPWHDTNKSFPLTVRNKSFVNYRIRLVFLTEWSESDTNKFCIHGGLDKLLGTTEIKLHQGYHVVSI